MQNLRLHSLDFGKINPRDPSALANFKLVTPNEGNTKLVYRKVINNMREIW